MTNNVELFNFQDKNVRTVLIDDKPFFLFTDVARVLEYKNVWDAKKFTYKEDRKSLRRKATRDLRGAKIWKNAHDFANKSFISEEGIYDLVQHSNAPQARNFSYWLSHEVLPQLRQNGSYSVEQSAEANEISGMPKSQILLIASQYAKENEKNKAALEASKKQNKLMKPKADFYDDVGNSRGAISVGDMAKLLKKNGINTGQNRFFKWLRRNHYLSSRRGLSWNTPTQKSLDMNIITFKEKPKTLPDGREFMFKTPLVTGKGQQYFYKKIIVQQTLIDFRY